MGELSDVRLDPTEPSEIPEIPLPEIVSKDSELTVKVADRLMSAYLSATSPEGEGHVPTFENVMAKLDAVGVVFGIKEDVVRQFVEEAALHPEALGLLELVLVAEGVYPVDGQDAHIEFLPILMESGGRPKVRQDGSVDLYDLNLVRNVTKGTVLATRTPPTDGTPGTTVLGEKIAARKGTDVRIQTGGGVSIPSDGLTAVANIDGHASLANGTITVTPRYEVNTDVSVETGNIEFTGTVAVKGNVLPGFHVKAGGDVEILGGVDGGTIESGGNITVQYGIKGGGRGRIVAKGSVRARFIEGAQVSAGTFVWAADGILHSHVDAGEGVEVVGKYGAIIGGRVSAKVSVAARLLGSAMGGAADIVVGSMPGVRDQLIQLRKQLADAGENLKRAEVTLSFLTEQSRKAVLPPAKRQIMSQLVQLQERLWGEQEEVKAKIAAVEKQLTETKEAWVEARGTCYPEVKITIGVAQMQVGRPMEKIRFKLNQDKEIEMKAAQGGGGS